MANPEHLAKLKEGVAAWNSWREANPDIKPDLIEGNFEDVDLSGVSLRGADLTGAKLSGADLSLADLSKADLSKAHLNEADLSLANLSRANLKLTDLRGANLVGANLFGTFLSGANLKKSNLRGADLIKADLSIANISLADLTIANLRGADLWKADLSKADLTQASLVETNLEEADLSDCKIYGISVWNVQLQDVKQTNLVITPPGEPAITVDNLEVAQFIYLLLKYEKLRAILNTVTQKGVLLLGRFGEGGLELLHAIADKLRELKYLPIIFDFDRPEDRDYTETVKTLVGLARFVIVELSGPSVPQELYATVPHFNIPFVPIMRKGSRQYAMFADLLKYPWVLSPPVEFEDTENLLELIPSKIIEPAEDKAKERQEQLSQIFKR